MINENRLIALPMYKSNSEKLQKQLDISEEVLFQIETNRIFENSKLYDYLYSFDSLLLDQNDKQKGNLNFSELRNENINRTRGNHFDTSLLSLKQQKEPSFHDQDYAQMKELDQIYNITKVNSKINENEILMNNYNTQSSQKESIVDNQNFIFDY